MVKKNDGIKESTDSTNTIEEDGEYILKASEYDQEIPQSQVTDQPMAPQGRDTEHRLTTARTQNKATSCSSLFLSKMIAESERILRTTSQKKNPTHKKHLSHVM